MTAEKAARTIPVWVVLPTILVAVVAAHAALLRLPYYWDEAGYYIPAAYDFFRTGSLIPYSTISNAHPPLPSLYLAVWWKVFHFAPLVTRTAMCVVAAVALAAVWRLALITTGKAQVAAATVLLSGLYPVFFAQSSLAHADLFAAAGTLWALAFFLEERIWLAAVCFSLAVLSKETAIVTPLALAVWESFRIPTSAKTGQKWGTRDSWRGRIQKVAALAAAVIPLAGWYAYHWRKTGFVFGNRGVRAVQRDPDANAAAGAAGAGASDDACDGAHESVCAGGGDAGVLAAAGGEGGECGRRCAAAGFADYGD